MLNEKTEVNGVTVVTYCGDSIITSPETCDDGNSKKGDGCSATCILETGFTCTGTGAGSCTEDCGDGLNFKSVSTTTQCDDGDEVAGDGCSNLCVVEAGWRCSGGSSTTADTCVEICGDGYNFDTAGTWAVGDKCDDANTIKYDGCFNCVTEEGWYCEPGSSTDSSTASSCYEKAMDGLDFGTFDCDVLTASSGCVDGAITDGWECYGGSKSVADTCTEICGDGIHYSTDATACDDGNYVDLDGCSSSCDMEDGFTIIDSTVGTATAHTFDEDCDGFDYGYLDCDCGSTGCDGCDIDCTVIKGWTCLSPTTPSDGSECTEICGDSINYDSASTNQGEDGKCDDGNIRNNDGCSSACLVEFGFGCATTDETTKDTCYEICGDGYDYKRYACDDGNSAENDGCSSSCEINEGWDCYGGSKTQSDTCYETCGDGRNYAYWYDDTACDDGNDEDNDGCDSSCNIEDGYDCVEGDYDSADYCYETCGDGRRFNSVTTYCDDGNTDATVVDGCDSGCFVVDGFYCYGGDSTAADSCFEECGDSIRYTDSTITTFCDDGNNEADDGCDADCVVESGWYCEGGSSDQPDTCYETCGDGLDFEEFECDDGNDDSGDGCSSSCDVEDNYECYGGTTSQADTCYDVCGDGLDMGPNDCDDGDLYSIDGCESDCTIRAGWNCAGGDHSTASTCYEICGDGYHYFETANSMECDDGNTDNHDGCDSDCLLEDGFICSTTWTASSTSTSVDPDFDTPTSCSEICQDGMNFNDDTTYCDTGDAAGTNGCTSTCDVVDGWYCMYGGYTAQDSCYEDCGDSYNWGALECDYLSSSMDGCSSSCEVEDGWYCLLGGVMTPSTLTTSVSTAHDCFEQCGDGMDFGNFGCDDGDNTADDGCDADCSVEEGWYCYGGDSISPDNCYEICGDDYNLDLLPCDDGNDASGDGCYGCEVEDGWYCPDYEVQNAAFTGTYATHYMSNYCYDICGDGFLVDDSMYACDDYDNEDGDGCSAKCQIERGHYCVGGDEDTTDICYETCGDGFNFPLTSGDCDDAGLVSGDGCSIYCEIEDGWYCFGGSSTTKDYCYEQCGYDSYDHGTYGCDDGNNIDDDGCSADCAVESGWSCSGGSSTDNDVCYDVCNDGVHMADGVSATAYCDDGNSDETDGCTSSCDILEGWTCSGGDSTAADTCTEVCGDGIDYGNYPCDAPNDDGCSSSCDIETGYNCVGGSITTVDTCYELCGDGLDLEFYACDDGNEDSGDGCSSTCTEESGYDCTGGTTSTADVCSAVCGDELIRSTETCDDGNTYDNDGCDSDCLIESEYDCDGGEPSTCTEICGDGLNMGQVECDDNDETSGDGCSSSCEVEEGWKCSGGSHTTPDTCEETDYISNSLAECSELAEKFFTTCDESSTESAPASLADVAGETQTCEDNYGGLCAGSLDNNGYCAWTRKLCVTCSKDFTTGYVMIRVQTNSFPDHCYYANKYAPIENLIDFSVGLSLQNNTIVTPKTTITTQTELDEQLCSYGWPNKTAQTDNLALMEYTEHSAGTDIDQVVGIALNGVPIFFGTSELGFDVFKPKTYNGQSAKSVPVDLCLGNNDYTRYYHYYTNSPCILSGTQKAAVAGGLCTDDTNCNTNKTKFIVAARSTLKNLQVVGIARDGKVILGPYKADGSVWSACEVDVCNGVIVGGTYANGVNTGGYYAYVTTTFHPYTVACFSRGSTTSLTAKCTTNPGQCTGSSSGSITTFSYLFALAYITLGLLLQ